MNENELKELFERRNISEIRHAVDNHREIKERVLACPPVGVAVKLPSAFALFEWFPTILREPLSASDTLSEATAPVTLPT